MSSPESAARDQAFAALCRSWSRRDRQAITDDFGRAPHYYERELEISPADRNPDGTMPWPRLPSRDP